MKIDDILTNLNDIKLFVEDNQKEAINCAIDILKDKRTKLVDVNDIKKSVDKKYNPTKVHLNDETLSVVNDLMKSVDKKDNYDLDILLELKKIVGLLEHMQWGTRRNGLKPDTDDDLK